MSSPLSQSRRVGSLFALGFAGLCGVVLTACGDWPQGSELTVIFKDGVSRAEVDAINAEIDATVTYAPQSGTAYRIQPPIWIDLRSGTAFYKSKPQVQAVLGAIDYQPL